jgi:hypothetical protein
MSDAFFTRSGGDPMTEEQMHLEVERLKGRAFLLLAAAERHLGLGDCPSLSRILGKLVIFGARQTKCDEIVVGLGNKRMARLDHAVLSCRTRSRPQHARRQLHSK